MASTDSEDEELKTAIALSLASTTENGSTTERSRSPPPSAATILNECPPNRASGLAGLDRRAMEAERLARQGRKRERSISRPPLRDSRKTLKLDEHTISLPSGAKLTSFSTLVHQDQQSRKSPAANAATQRLKSSPPDNDVKLEPEDGSEFRQEHSRSYTPQGTLRYPKGVVKKTWAFGFERDGSDIKLEEVLEPQTLHTAVLSAFQWDLEWVLRKLKVPPHGGKTKCVFVMQAKEESLREHFLAEIEPYRKFLRLCFPPMIGQINCMHSKLMLLFHPNKLRIAIPTANLLDFDWGETGYMENSVFMIDLPRLPENGKSEGLTPFAQELLFFLQKQGLNEDITNGVLNFDFSATQGMAFVHTVGGASYGEDAARTGLAGLASCVRQLELQAEGNLQIDFAASSIGSLNDDFLRNVHAAASGRDMVAGIGEAASKAKADFFTPAAKKTPGEGMAVREKIRIYFPTHETVTSSRAGAAGTICLQKRWFEASTFPRSCFRDYRSVRAGLLSHNKILYARGKRVTSGSEGSDVAWVYIGSANLSESAWGKLVYDKKAKASKINCRNWECGVLLPVPMDVKVKQEVIKKEKVEGEDSETESEDDGEAQNNAAPNGEIVGMGVFEDIFKPPFEVPGARYGSQQPWFFEESQG